MRRRPSYEVIEELWSVSERETTISRPMLVPTLEWRPGIAKQQRSRHHQRTTMIRAVLKRTSRNNSDRKRGMLLFERFVGRSSSANEIGYSPAVAFREHPHSQSIVLVARTIVT